MKNYHFILFIIIVLTIFTIGNLYIFFKGYNVIPPVRSNRIVYKIVFITLASTFFAGRILESWHSSVISDILNIIGGFWLSFLFYGFLFLIISDITGLLLRTTGIMNINLMPDYRKWSFLVTLVLSVLFIAGGFINAIMPVIKKYDITIDKTAGDIKELRIAAVSDIHLGSIIRKRSMKKLSDMLEKAEPDVIFLLGDIVDGDLGPVLRGDLLKYFTRPETRYGLFAITGNHEFIGGAERTIKYIESKGIRVLKDETVFLPGGIQIIGRLDRVSSRFQAGERLPLVKLTENCDPSGPLIVLDHQPLNLDEAENCGVDLQLSGHTHNGQMWPLNYITNILFEVSYGYYKKGNTQIVVSSGFGLWGPRVRSGSRSEVVVIDISFRSNNHRGE
ncbi:MAG: metallophosphoesterase [Bacteroidales bacterium]|nr:metallophosphoesterase [Bacteroidales bacterium]